MRASIMLALAATIGLVAISEMTVVNAIGIEVMEPDWIDKSLDVLHGKRNWDLQLTLEEGLNLKVAPGRYPEGTRRFFIIGLVVVGTVVFLVFTTCIQCMCTSSRRPTRTPTTRSLVYV